MKMNPVNFLRTSESNLRRLKAWQSNKSRRKIQKSQNSNLNIGFIGQESLFESLRFEAELFTLTEANYLVTLKFSDLDFILIESCSETFTNDWHYAQLAGTDSSIRLNDLISSAKKHNIPVVYWITLGKEYLPQCEAAYTKVDHVYCADKDCVEILEKQGVESKYLPPAVQPALFNRLKFFNENQQKEPKIATIGFDGLVDVLQTTNKKHRFYDDLCHSGAVFYDSFNTLWKPKLKPLHYLGDSVLGSIVESERREIYPHLKAFGILNSQISSKTRLKWRVLEAAASHLPVVAQSDVDLDEFSSLLITCESDSELLTEIASLSEDELYRERLGQLNWRSAVLDHCFAKRIQKICKDIGLHHDWNEFPSATMITPSYREDFISRASHSYQCQNYPNKSWILVFNGESDRFSDISRQVANLGGVASFVPSELHAGPCMNTGIALAKSDFVFRMDDDDFYGPNYLLDLMLYTRVTDFDVLGKPFRYFVQNGKGTIYSRQSSSVLFDMPSAHYLRAYPHNVNLIAGCSQGGNRSFFLSNRYPQRNYSAVDTEWIFSLDKIGNNLVISTDSFNLLVDRRTNGEHTWNANVDNFIKASQPFNLRSDEVCFV